MATRVRLLFSTIARVAAVGGVGGAGFASYKIDQDEGARRSFTFWKSVFPIYLHYRYYQLLNRDLKWMPDEEAAVNYERLHSLYSDRVRELTYRMRGFYLKQAQLMSTMDNFVPPAYMKWVKDTQDKVPSEFQGTEAREYCAKLLREEQGLNFDEVFSEWDDEPIGVASIGQVHRARLKLNDQLVAVKLLVPGMEPKFRSDIRTIKSFCQLAMPQHVSSFDEIEKQFCSEFDYEVEAKNLATIHENLMEEWHTMIHIPRPFLQYCSKHVLVMEYLRGKKLVDGIRDQFSELAALSGSTLEEIEAERKEQIASGTFVFKSIQESHAEAVRTQRLLWLKDLSNPINWQRGLYNWTMGWVVSPVPYERSTTPIDLGHILELLCRVHACQIFKHGVFNGDPHPGNFMLLEDGRIGLIDFGQMKLMSQENRKSFAKLILAHARGDKEEIIRLHFDPKEIGTVTKYKKPEIGYLMSSVFTDRMTKDVMGEKNIADFIDWLEAEDPMVQQPEAFLFAFRVSLLLRGMGNAFGIQLRMSKMWEDEAKAYLKEHQVDY